MQKPVGVNFLARRWVVPVSRTLGTWAFVFNRWSGILLTIYLFVHLGILTTLAFAPAFYDQFLVIANSPLGLLFDVGLILLLLYHALNGLRIIAVTFIGEIDQHRAQFWAVVVATVLLTLYSAILIFGE